MVLLQPRQPGVRQCPIAVAVSAAEAVDHLIVVSLQCRSRIHTASYRHTKQEVILWSKILVMFPDGCKVTGPPLVHAARG
jgi:hypothetical protein